MRDVMFMPRRIRKKEVIEEEEPLEEVKAEEPLEGLNDLEEELTKIPDEEPAEEELNEKQNGENVEEPGESEPETFDEFGEEDVETAKGMDEKEERENLDLATETSEEFAQRIMDEERAKPAQEMGKRKYVLPEVEKLQLAMAQNRRYLITSDYVYRMVKEAEAHSVPISEIIEEPATYDIMIKQEYLWERILDQVAKDKEMLSLMDGGSQRIGTVKKLFEAFNILRKLQASVDNMNLGMLEKRVKQKQGGQTKENLRKMADVTRGLIWKYLLMFDKPMRLKFISLFGFVPKMFGFDEKGKALFKAV